MRSAEVDPMRSSATSQSFSFLESGFEMWDANFHCMLTVHILAYILIRESPHELLQYDASISENSRKSCVNIRNRGMFY